MARTRSWTVWTGAATMLTAQLSTVVGQFVYSAFTARVLSPTDFGEFAIALSLYGLLNLPVSSAVVSVILSERDLSDATVFRMRVFAACGGLFAALLLLVVSGRCYELFGSLGSAIYTQVFVIALFAGPICALEGALFRRESHARIDAAILITGYILSAGVAATVIYVTRDARGLALVPLISTAAGGLLSSICRDRRYSVVLRGASRTHLHGIGVMIQNLGFLVLSLLPTWSLGFVAGPEPVGQFSRAASITITVSATVLGALYRVIAPVYRTVDASRMRDAVGDMFLVAIPIIALPYITLAIVSPILIPIWLGPGWDPAIQLCAILSLGCIAQVLTGLVTNALEMLRNLSAVRVSIGSGLATMVAFLGALYFTHQPVWAAVAHSTSAWVGLFALLVFGRIGGKPIFANRYRQLVAQVIPVILVNGGGALVVYMASRALLSIDSSTLNGCVILLLVGTAGLFLMLIVLFTTPARKILAERGIVRLNMPRSA
ncbi:oligosaccharide flippase family protein [Gordonia jinghuaiqii]|uniref:Oligosaccharide flippase family protein n=1 Tax=Gordonia jinghuaiqii TaxID=2758710 RepID=A0A7D7LZE1_9ACTN|nr:oligosaccharide flippase family protein [Gordonia jinghuaiqii]MCR5977921.1 oligosaccharide flippase family protein [Gordonia jinghuaiqii]QMT02576.1 oligosaccharide flippase family protein [Gordonia jinghuaiqii]